MREYSINFVSIVLGTRRISIILCAGLHEFSRSVVGLANRDGNHGDLKGIFYELEGSAYTSACLFTLDHNRIVFGRRGAAVTAVHFVVGDVEKHDIIAVQAFAVFGLGAIPHDDFFDQFFLS